MSRRSTGTAKARTLFAAVMACAVVVLAGAGALAEEDKATATRTLTFTFIGNAAVSVTDGEIFLMNDWPYRSGTFDSMRYEFDSVVWEGDVVCLITHAHADHFDVNIFQMYSFTLIAHETVTRVFPGYRVYPATEPMQYEGIEIVPYETPHGELPHLSYEVTWHGVRMFFTGDTEDPRYLLGAKDLDVAFVTPWLLDIIYGSGETIDAKKVVVYHHNELTKPGVWKDAVTIPKQKDVFEIEFRK